MVGGIAFWLTGGRYVGTDDAYIEANKLLVSTDVSGLVLDVDVNEGQKVHRGDVLFRLDPQPFRIALQQAQSHMDEVAQTIRSEEAGLHPDFARHRCAARAGAIGANQLTTASSH